MTFSLRSPPPPAALWRLVALGLPVLLFAAVAWAGEVPPDGALVPDCADDVVAGVGEDTSLSGQLRAALSAGNLAVALVLVLLGGLLTALSPCVYPLIPITLSILGARQAATPFRGFLLAATYVGGMVVLYTSLGVGFAWAGFLAGSALQSAWVTIGVALFCAVMAASMFGAFELVLPSGLQTRLSQAGGGGFKGAFVMGLVAGIIAAPCTGPVLSFILTLIARERDLAKGALLMFVFALGMGLPFLVLGTFSQAIARMPKSGRWMESVKSVFGLLMLGAGLYYLQLGIPAVAAVMAPLGQNGALLGPVLLIVGVAVGALHLSFKHSALVDKVRKGTGVAIATAGILAFLAWTNAGPAPSSGTAAEVAWVKIGAGDGAAVAFDEALARAKQQCRPVLIDFGADWCIACKELDKFTFSDDAVREESRRFVNIKVDATSDTADLTSIQERFGVVGLPTVAFISKQGTYLGPEGKPVFEPVTGFVKAPAFLEIMKRVP
jgi:thioredoxin:protein disulfide reductase